MKSFACFVMVIAAAAVGGCSGAKVSPPSAFYSAVDLQAVVKQCAPQGVKWGSHGFRSSGGGSPSNFHRNFNGDMQCEEETLDSFLQALKNELQKSIQAHGGRVASSVVVSKDELPKAVARRGVKQMKDGKAINVVGLSGFQLNYEVGATPGEILVIVSRNEAGITDPYPLNLSVDVFESSTAGQTKPGSDR